MSTCLDDAAQSQLHDAPVVARDAAAAGFPAVHPFAVVGIFVGNENAAAGLKEVFFLGEKLVVREEGNAAEAGRGQVDEAGWSGRVIGAHASDSTPAISAVGPGS